MEHTIYVVGHKIKLFDYGICEVESAHMWLIATFLLYQVSIPSKWFMSTGQS